MSLDEIDLTPEQVAEAAQRWPQFSAARQAQYMRMSILAHIKHQQVVDPETGRRAFGGPQPGGGPHKNKRIGQALLDEAQSRHREIINAAFAPLGPGNTPMDRHKAAMNIARHELLERQQEIIDDEYARKSDDEIRVEAAKLLASMIRAGQLDKDIINGSATDITDQQQIS